MLSADWRKRSRRAISVDNFVPKAGAAIKHGEEDRAILGASGSYPPR